MCEKERLYTADEIKAKYANGVPAGEIEKWLGVK